jgi:hypothetical protein
MRDEITRAVLAREEIAKYLQGSHGESGRAARWRIDGYLEELRTRQRHSIYRALWCDTRWDTGPARMSRSARRFRLAGSIPIRVERCSTSVTP